MTVTLSPFEKTLSSVIRSNVVSNLLMVVNLSPMNLLLEMIEQLDVPKDVVIGVFDVSDSLYTP